MESNRKTKLTVVYLVSFLDLFAVSLAVPLMSTHLKSLGASHLVIGLTSTLYFVTQLISGPVVGSWSDRHGRSRVLIICLILSACCYLALGATNSLAFILMTRIVLGCFKHTQILCKTLLADILPHSDHSGALGTLSAVSGAGFVVGPAVGGHFAEQHGSFPLLCCIVAFTFLINAGLVFMCLSDVDREREKRPVIPGSTVIKLKAEFDSVVSSLVQMDWKSYGDVLALKVFLAFSIAFYFNNYSLSLRERFEVSPKIIGYLISFQALIGAVSGILSSYVHRAYMRYYSSGDITLTRVIHAYALLAVALLGQWGSVSVITLLPWLAPIGASKSTLRDLLTELLFRRCPLSQRGSVVGSASSLGAIAKMTAPLVAGFAVDSIGSSATVALAQIAATGGLVLALTMSRRETLQRAK